MKILIGSLLFATAILINFPELNSSPQPSSGAGPSRSNYNVENIQQQGTSLEHTSINIFKQEIQVDLARIGDRIEAVDCKVLRSTHDIPTKSTKRNCNFMTVADFKRIETREIITIALYVKEDERKVRTLLGAKLPPPPGRNPFQKGDPRNLRPDYKTWYITYKGIDFEVEVEPYSQNNVDIKPYGRQNVRPSDKEIKKHWHEYPFTHFGGLYFIVFRDNNHRVEGAALDPFWLHRPGEVFQNENPHINPHIRPQKNLPLEPIPEPEEISESHHYLEQQQLLERQYYFGQHHDANQQQNLYQNPYSYEHQFPYQNQIPYNPYFDPSQHNPHFDPSQHNPHFDTSQHNPQQGGSQTPHYRLNENGHYQLYPPTNP